MSVQDQLDKMDKGILSPSPATNAPSKMKLPFGPGAGMAKPAIKTGGTAPGDLAKFSQEFKDVRERLKKLLEQQGQPATIPLEQLHKSPYQTRLLDELRIAELMENLRHNPLSTPITVRYISEGKYEIVAGHHREEAYSRLGRTEIPASVINLTDAEARRLVFFDNLMAPKISDYEKFKGFTDIKESEGLTIEALAIQSGMSVAFVTLIMSFARLPASALEVLNQWPNAIGANLAKEMAALPDHYTERVKDAIQKVADGSLKQAQAIAWITEKKAADKPQWAIVKSGRSKFAELSVRDKQVVIRFSDPEEAAAIQAELIEVLNRRASSQK